jgi:hypothetical protein
MSFFALLSRLMKYAPLIEAIFRAIEEGKTAEESAAAATAIERGFHVLNQTKDPRALEDALRAHCGPNGCLLP